MEIVNHTILPVDEFELKMVPSGSSLMHLVIKMDSIILNVSTKLYTKDAH